MRPPASRTPVHSSVDELHDSIRQWILTGELEPGAVTSQVKLAARLGVGRTPVREALRMLQREGLIDAEYNHRVRIAPTTTSDLETLYSIRIPQEALATRLSVPRLTAEDLDEQTACLAAMDAAVEAGDFKQWDRVHRLFHQSLGKYAGARALALLAELFDHGERYRRALYQLEPTAVAIGAREHASISKACRAGDALAASQHLVRQLGRTSLSLISASDPTHDPVAIREALKLANAA